MKLVMDFPGVIPLRAGMDDDCRNLIISLCRQVGMMMEDASPVALTARCVADDDLAGRIGEIDAAIRQILVFISAAAMLGAREAQTQLSAALRLI